MRLALIALVAGAASCARGPSFDDYLAALADSAGPDAATCGVIRLPAARAEAARCAQSALAAGRPFWVTFQAQGIDSSVFEGLTATPNGEVWRLVWDSDAYGGGSLAPLRQVHKIPCENAQLVDRPGEEIIRCP